jgi:anaerobic selenocysteine-containing dehydrogenase
MTKKLTIAKCSICGGHWSKRELKRAICPQCASWCAIAHYVKSAKELLAQGAQILRFNQGGAE